MAGKEFMGASEAQVKASRLTRAAVRMRRGSCKMVVLIINRMGKEKTKIWRKNLKKRRKLMLRSLK